MEAVQPLPQPPPSLKTPPHQHKIQMPLQRLRKILTYLQQLNAQQNVVPIQSAKLVFKAIYTLSFVLQGYNALHCFVLF